MLRSVGFRRREGFGNGSWRECEEVEGVACEELESGGCCLDFGSFLLRIARFSCFAFTWGFILLMDHFGEVLHNSYVNSGLALRALFGPGRDLLFDGLRASKNVSPNMNSLLRFESVASFIISVVSLLYPGLDWDATQHSLMNWSCFLVSCSLGVLWKKG